MRSRLASCVPVRVRQWWRANQSRFTAARQTFDLLDTAWSAWERLPGLAKTAVNAAWWFVFYFVLPRRTVLLSWLRLDSVALSIAMFLTTWAVIEIVRYHRPVQRKVFLKELTGTVHTSASLEVKKIPAGQETARELAQLEGMETERSVKIHGVPALAGTPVPIAPSQQEPTLDIEWFERYRREWADKPNREVAKATAREYIASHPKMVREFGGKSYEELVKLVDAHRAAGRTDEVTRVGMWITGGLPPQVITGTAEITIGNPRARGDGNAFGHPTPDTAGSPGE